MIAVIFEAEPATGQMQTYLDLAASLRTQLTEIEGFISIERFQSLSDPKRLLSLSFWRDEIAVAQWRQLESHRRAQAAARDRVFDDYRLRIAEVIRDYGMTDRVQAPTDSKTVHDLPA